MFDIALQAAVVAGIAGAGFGIITVAGAAVGLFIYRDRPGRRRRAR